MMYRDCVFVEADMLNVGWSVMMHRDCVCVEVDILDVGWSVMMYRDCVFVEDQTFYQGHFPTHPVVELLLISKQPYSEMPFYSK